MQKKTSPFHKIAIAGFALISAITFTSLPTQQAEAHQNGKQFKCFSHYGERIPGVFGKKQARYIRQNGGSCHRKQHSHQQVVQQPIYNQPWQEPYPTYNDPFDQSYGGNSYNYPTTYPKPPVINQGGHKYGNGKVRKAVRVAKNRYARLGRFVRAENFSRGGFKYKKFTLVFKKGHKIKRVRVKANAWSGKVKWVKKI